MVYNKDGIKKRILRSFASIGYNPESVWEKDWNLLIVLDACRKDVMEAVAPGYEYLDSISEYTSAGSCTPEWLNDTFSQEYESSLSETAYVTGNPNSIRAFPYNFPQQCDCGSGLDPSYSTIHYNGEHKCESCGNIINGDREIPVQTLREVWRENWDNEYGTILPRPITDAAIKTARKHNPRYLIVHYMQPHHPFISAPNLDKGFQIVNEDESPEKMSKTIWEKLNDSEISEKLVWEKYRENLKEVLDDVKILLDNADFDSAVITTDHGNAIGEYGLYGHFKNIPISCLVDVPWCITKAEDNRNYFPEDDSASTKKTTGEAYERLRDLGYV